jgi:2-polyprenyl-3-methyl-5-hydroxy-6-metoxy-1,4-benzoquinol methylase
MTTTADHPYNQLDATAVEEFAGRLVGVLSDGCLALMISIGHQVGLFDTLAGLPPSTSAQIAAAAGLDERYVREWLGAMTVGKVVVYADETYALPAEHAAVLARAAGADNLSHVMQFIPLLAGVEQDVVSCFRAGGGVPYAAYQRFHEVMAEDSATVHDAALVDVILPLVPGLTDRLAAGIDAADIGCGQGHAVNLMAAAFPRSRFTGYDLSESAIVTARQEAATHDIGNARFEVCDVAELDVPAAFDLVTAFDAIHDQAHPARVLANVAAALRSGGTFLMVDIRASSDVADNLDLPWAPALYTLSTMHCMTVSLALGGDGLGAVWGRQTATRMLGEAGFDVVDVKQLDTDPWNYYYIATAPRPIGARPRRR